MASVVYTEQVRDRLRKRGLRVVLGQVTVWLPIVLMVVVIAAFAITRPAQAGYQLGVGVVVLALVAALMWRRSRRTAASIPLGSTLTYRVNGNKLQVHTPLANSVVERSAVASITPSGDVWLLRMASTPRGFIMIPREALSDAEVAAFLSQT